MKLTSCIAALAMIAIGFLFTGCPAQEGQPMVNAESGEAVSGETDADVATSEGAEADEAAARTYAINQALPGKVGTQSGSISVPPGVGPGDGPGQGFVVGQRLTVNIGRVEKQQTGTQHEPYDPAKRCEEAVYSVRVNGVICDHPENCVFILPSATAYSPPYRMIISPVEADVLTSGLPGVVELFNATLPDSKEQNWEITVKPSGILPSEGKVTVSFYPFLPECSLDKEWQVTFRLP